VAELRRHWRWRLLNLGAVAVLVGILINDAAAARGDYVAAGYQRGLGDYQFFDPLFELRGRWAIRFLLFALAMTPLNSLLGWRWKRLHRLVYYAGVAMVVHVLLAAQFSKSFGSRGEGALLEYQLYLLIVVFLLALRLPFVRAGLLRVVNLPPLTASSQR
jgi:DMSO/TMAO reductase YedYZ heme-binding membrane subunit